MELRCIQCGFRVKKLLVQYSPGNIRLMKCENCKAVADEYVECEIMILLIDLILHKPKAYRHLLYNMPNRDSVSFKGLLWKSTFGFLLLDAYMILVLKRSGEEWSLYMNFSSLLWRCGKILMDVFIGNFMFLCTILLAKRILLDTSGRVSRYKDLVLAILFSSYFKIFLIPMMVWEFPFSVIFIIDVFVLSSNTVALKGWKLLLKGRSFWVVNIPGECCWTWRKILKLRSVIRPFIKHSVGKETNTFLWYDKWHCGVSLLIPHVFFVTARMNRKHTCFSNATSKRQFGKRFSTWFEVSVVSFEILPGQLGIVHAQDEISRQYK